MPTAFRFEGDMASSSTTRAALAWARNGAKIIALHGINDAGNCTCGSRRCRSPGKHPIADMFPKGQHSATTDASTIRRAFAKYPRANLGVILPPGIVALDVDGPEGVVTFKSLNLPITLSVATGRGTHTTFVPQSKSRKKEPPSTMSTSRTISAVTLSYRRAGTTAGNGIGGKSRIRLLCPCQPVSWDG
jgi:hypothetical protein